jgi:DnaK suppressor protein
MEAAEIEKFRQMMLGLRTELLGLEKASEEATRPVALDQASVGRLSRMDAMQAQQMALETARRRQLELAKLDGALRRIKSGEYGYCVVCGEEIDVRRLAVAPASTRCVTCVEK